MYEDKAVEAMRARYAEIGISGLYFVAVPDFDREGPAVRDAIRAASDAGMYSIAKVHLFGCNGGSPVWAGLQSKGCKHHLIPGYFEAKEKDRSAKHV